MIKCSECGYENMDGLDYCDGCGAKLAASEGAAAAPAASASAAQEAAPAAAAAPAGSEPATTPAADGAAVSAEPEAPSAAEAPTGEITPPPAAAPAAAAPPQFKAKLKLLRGVPEERKGSEFPLEAGQNFIGRWDPETGSFPEVDLERDDPEAKISRKHALIIIEGSKITIEDIGSLNGTYVNRGSRLIPGTPLEIKSGDEVIIGKTFMRLVVDPIS